MSFWAIAKIIWVVEFVESVDFSVFLLFFKIRMGVHESTEASNKIQINTKKTQHCTKASLAFPIIQNTTLVDAKAEYHPVTKTDGPFLGHTGYSLRPVTSTFTNKTMLQHFNGHQKLGEEEGKLFCWDSIFLRFFVVLLRFKKYTKWPTSQCHAGGFNKPKIHGTNRCGKSTFLYIPTRFSCFFDLMSIPIGSMYGWFTFAILYMYQTNQTNVGNYIYHAVGFLRAS